MKNGNKPANPINTFAKEGDLAISKNEFQGLTKREMIAMNLMGGILSNQDFSYNGFSGAALMAIEAADALLEGLEK